MPRGTIRFPVFLGMATYDGDLDAVINYLLSRDEPAIMLLPSIEDVPQAKIISAGSSAVIRTMSNTTTHRQLQTVRSGSLGFLD